MATRKLNLTRDQLATFLKDFEQIKQFEALFATVDAIAPDFVNEVFTLAANADTKAIQALGQIAEFAQAAAVCCAAAENKATEALDSLASLQQESSTSTALADSRAQQALQMATEAQQTAQATALDVSALAAKTTQALDNLARLTDAVELLATAPPPRQPKRARYGQFVDTTTQIATAINTPKAITLNTTEVSSGVFLGTPTSRIYVDEAGIYNFLYSIQIDKTSGGTGIFWVWPRINGVDVPNSNSQVQIQGNNAEQLVTIGYFFELKTGDYVEIMFAVNDVSVQVEQFPASAFYPAIPSIILTVTDNIQGVQA